MKLPLAPPDLEKILGTDPQRSGDVMRRILSGSVRSTVDDRYRHWHTLRQLTPPDGLTHEEWWLGIKMARIASSRNLPLTDAKGAPFVHSVSDEAAEMLLRIDQQARGEVEISELATNRQSRRRYLVSSLIEEAITSSQLEGASTTRRVAKDMITSGRPPRDTSERMIFNNYRAMNLIREWTHMPLTSERILELHRVVTEGTLDDPLAAGRLQRPGEQRVSVVDRIDGKVLHAPPPAEMLPERIKRLCEFANGGTTQSFLHPVVRAIVVHLWLAYDHPFEDGNGRTARALFYWSMLSQGYWLTEFLSISRILKQAPARYARAFLFTETDGLEATYFILHQVGVIGRAIDELHDYLRQKTQEVHAGDELVRDSDLNHRQIALIQHALRHPDTEYTFKSHMTSHRVVYHSARADLLALEERDLVMRRVVGREFRFRPAADLADRLNAIRTAAADR